MKCANVGGQPQGCPLLDARCGPVKRPPGGVLFPRIEPSATARSASHHQGVASPDNVSAVNKDPDTITAALDAVRAAQELVDPLLGPPALQLGASEAAQIRRDFARLIQWLERMAAVAQ
jgi:hypothetical protein